MKNRYGVDVDYFKNELISLYNSLDSRTPEELAQYLLTLSYIACSPWKKYPDAKPEKFQDCVVINDLGKVFHAVFIKHGFAETTDKIILWSPIHKIPHGYSELELCENKGGDA